MKAWAIVVGVSLGITGSSLAHPLDSPGTVYIDGVPCNLHCQSYMAWSRQTLKANQAAAKRTANRSAIRALAESPYKRIAKRPGPASADAASRKRTSDSHAALTVAPEPPPIPTPRTEAAPLNVETRNPPAGLTTTPEPPPVTQPKPESASISADSSNTPKERTPRELVVAALAVAEQMTNAEPSKATGGDDANGIKAGDTNLSAPRDTSKLVAVLIAGPDIKSASALKGQNVAIDAAQSAVEQDIRSALAAAGATDAQLSAADASPIDRIMSGDVQAAVVKLVSPDAAEAFPDIKGFKVFRVPLEPR